MTDSMARNWAFEGATLPNVVMDPETYRFLDCNSAAARMYGFASISETLGKTPSDVSADVQYDGRAAADLIREHIDRALRQGPVVFEWLHQRPNGQRWDAEVHLARFQAGDRLLLQFTLVDITERMAATRALRESEAKYRFITESIRDVVWTMDVETLRFLYVSPSVKQLRGFTPEEVMAVPMDAALTEDASQKVRALLSRRIARFESGETSDLTTTSLTEELPQPCKDGSVVWTEVVTGFRRNPMTGKVELHGVSRDLTERRKAEAKLRESEARFRVLFEQAGLAIVVLNDAGVVVECNHRALETFRCTSAELVGAHLWDFSPATQPNGTESQAGIWAKIRAALEGEPQTFEWTHRRLDQSEFPAEIGLNAIRMENGVLVLGTIDDITERRRVERERENLQAQFLQAQKMEAVGRLAGGVAHDFNNLLSVILGRSDLMLSEMPATHPLRGELESILEAANRSAGLTRQLLAFARKQKTEPRAIELNSVIQGTLQMLRRLMGEDVELVWIPGQDLAAVVMDPSQLDQIVANLCVNARDAIGGVGKVVIETSNCDLDEAYCAGQPDLVPGAYVMLAFSDTGSGMTDEIRKHLFEPFFTTKPIGKGTGLGLSTVYGIVQQNHGFICAYSSPGVGTTFKIFLPRAKATAGHQVSLEVEEKWRASGEAVLLVEDEPILCGLIQAMLEKYGFKVLATNRPTLAVELARTYPGDIALMVSDVIMPEMNGRDLHATIRGLRPQLRCLFLSGYTADILAHHGALEEGTTFLSKPFIAKSLAAKVFELLAGPVRRP